MEGQNFSQSVPWGGVEVGIVDSGGLGAAAGLGRWLGRRSLITKMASRSEGVRDRIGLVMDCGGVVNTFTTAPSIGIKVNVGTGYSQLPLLFD